MRQQSSLFFEKKRRFKHGGSRGFMWFVLVKISFVVQVTRGLFTQHNDTVEAIRVKTSNKALNMQQSAPG